MAKILTVLLLLCPQFLVAEDEYMPVAPEPSTEVHEMEYVPKASDGPKSDLKAYEQTYDE